jgi:hypothetical protein
VARRRGDAGERHGENSGRLPPIYRVFGDQNGRSDHRGKLASFFLVVSGLAPLDAASSLCCA